MENTNPDQQDSEGGNGAGSRGGVNSEEGPDNNQEGNGGDGSGSDECSSSSDGNGGGSDGTIPKANKRLTN